MPFIDAWYDWWRFIVFLFCLICLMIQVNHFKKFSKDWNVKTLDYWYSVAMWNATGACLTLEGILRNRPFAYTLIFATAAALSGFKGLIKTGAWGNHDQ